METPPRDIPSGPLGDILIYQGPDGSLELKGDNAGETIWANQAQIAQIFGVDRTVITKHLSNIFKSDELDKKVVSANFAHTTPHGFQIDKTQTRNVVYYNLDVILAVGYRVNSGTATKFRQRATKTLKLHISEGFTINHKRIQHNYETFLRAVQDIKQLNTNKVLNPDDVLELIHAFGKTWFTLDSFDKKIDFKQPQTISEIKIDAKRLYEVIAVLKQELIKKGEATELFALEKEQGTLGGIFANIFQSAFGEDVYQSIESKASHLLYFVVKNHPFNDGNKRSGAFAFIRFLQKANYPFMSHISPEALAAITLLVAASNPREKEKVIALIMLLLSPSV